MNTKSIKHFEELLLAEKAELEKELSEIAKSDSRNRGGWEASAGEIDVDSADENELADKFEELEDNAGIINKLEDQLMEINDALEKIKKDTYGICEKCGKPIETERLEANPSARISIKHDHK